MKTTDTFIGTVNANPTAARVRLPVKPAAGERVAGLRELAAYDPLNAQDAAWAWIERLGRLAAKDVERASRELATIFELGLPPDRIDGPADGRVLTSLFGPRADAVMRRVGANWMPWMGKRFHPSEQRGENRITSEFGLVCRLVWPGYATRPNLEGRTGFDFETRVERGAIEPAVEVLVIDYASVAANPKRIVGRIRDELVEIVPGTYLGRMLWLERDGRYRNVGYFALRNNQF